MSEHVSFVFGDTLFKQISAMSDDLRLKFYDYIVKFGLFQEEPILSGIELALWIGMKDAIDNFGGNRRGAPRGNKNNSSGKNQHTEKQKNATLSPSKEGVLEDDSTQSYIIDNASITYNDVAQPEEEYDVPTVAEITENEEKINEKNDIISIIDNTLIPVWNENVSDTPCHVSSSAWRYDMLRAIIPEIQARTLSDIKNSVLNYAEYLSSNKKKSSPMYNYRGVDTFLRGGIGIFVGDRWRQWIERNSSPADKCAKGAGSHLFKKYDIESKEIV